MSQDEAGRSYGHSFSNWRASGSAENLMIRKCCFIRCFCSSFTTFHHFSWLFIACHTCKIWQQICHPLSCIKTPGINAPLVLTYIENYWNAFRGPNLQSGGQYHTRGMGLGRYVIYIYTWCTHVMSYHILPAVASSQGLCKARRQPRKAARGVAKIQQTFTEGHVAFFWTNTLW